MYFLHLKHSYTPQLMHNVSGMCHTALSLQYHFVKNTALRECNSSTKEWELRKQFFMNSFSWQTEVSDNEYLQSALRCISASGSSSVSGAGPCTELLKRLPVFRFTKAKMKKCIKKRPSVSRCTQPVSAMKMDERQKGDSLYCCGGPLMGGSTSRVSHTWGREVHLAGFFMHSCVAQGLCLWVHHCTAVQLMVKGRRRRSERRKERRWRSSRASPASLGTCPGRQLQLLLWGKVSSAWLPLASPERLPLCPRLYPQTFCFSVFFCFDSLPLLICTIFLFVKAASYLVMKSLLKSSSLLSSMSGLQCLHPTKWQVRQAEWDKYVSSPRFKISPPPW